MKKTSGVSFPVRANRKNTDVTLSPGEHEQGHRLLQCNWNFTRVLAPVKAAATEEPASVASFEASCSAWYCLSSGAIGDPRRFHAP